MFGGRSVPCKQPYTRQCASITAQLILQRAVNHNLASGWLAGLHQVVPATNTHAKTLTQTRCCRHLISRPFVVFVDRARRNAAPCRRRDRHISQLSKRLMMPKLRTWLMLTCSVKVEMLKQCRDSLATAAVARPSLVTGFPHDIRIPRC